VSLLSKEIKCQNKKKFSQIETHASV